MDEENTNADNIPPSAQGDSLASSSLFAHEHAAQSTISQFVKSHGLGVTLPNLDVHDPQSNRYFELDLVIVSAFGVYAVELKHWSGRIEIRPNSWVQNNSFFKADPHKSNNFKAKLLRGFFERQFPQFPPVYFESVVVLTNPDVSAHGASIPTTTAHNPTFDSVDRFSQYLKNQRKTQRLQITEPQCRAFADYLKKLHSTGTPRDFIFPGYEVVERLYQHVDRAEVIAKRTDIRHRKLSRLRIFYLPSEKSEADRRRAHEQATATLNAVAKVGDHANILKVWSVPNENNYIVEGSDWSETGTLADVIDRGGRINAERAQEIAGGLALGLCEIHRHCVVHRALSPENVLMVNDTPKLMNFDLSFQLEDDRVTVIPDATRLKRSPYIAPEVYAGGDIPDGKADLFSLGVVLYESLTGHPPFGCSTDLERSQGVLTPASRNELVKHNTPKPLIDLVLDLVQTDPGRRPVDAVAVINRLHTPPEVELRIEVNPQLASGEQSGLYAIDEYLGAGAESQIYLARGVGGRKIALKIFDRDVPQQRIVNEHRFTGAVLHPNIVRVDSYGQWADNRYFIAFEWISSKNLRDDHFETSRPTPDRFITVTRQALNALAALHNNIDEDGHANPILHNDIKPDNILLGLADRPVLVDFGAASGPRIGTYEGTEGYVAPDLRLGQDRSYCEDGDRYALTVTLREWLLGNAASDDTDVPPGFTQAVCEWLKKGASTVAAERFPSISDMRFAFEEALAPTTPEYFSDAETNTESSADVESVQHAEAELSESTVAVPEPTQAGIQEVAIDLSLTASQLDPNPFVAYLNSLHSRSAVTDNALAESQATNPFFTFIHVSHPLVNAIETVLLGQVKRHVIVTGHAGDGKSTIAVELIKRLGRVPIDQPLIEPLTRRIEIVADGIAISLIKDFSEWSPDDRRSLLGEMIIPEGKRFFLISNTGTLLDTFRDHEYASHGDWVAIESDLLTAMSKPQGNEISFHQTPFLVLNMAMIDNLGIAKSIFSRMIATERWQACTTCECQPLCPISKNVELIQKNQTIVTQRLFLAYRRMFEYGTRLTLRQLCAHMAYMVTSGLSYQDVVAMGKRATRPLVSDFMFFNRFFGDNGSEVDEPALQIRAIRATRGEGFGEQLCPTWERQLWLKSRGEVFQLRANASPETFDLLQQSGAGIKSSDSLTSAHAREQVRRIVFFLHSFEPNDDGAFLKTFLKSVMLLDYARWQEQSTNTLTLQETTSLRRHVMHVLREHFTGVRLPEGVASDRYLIVTLSRRSNELRQSAQIVLARYPEDDFCVRLRTDNDGAGGIRRELVLDGEESAALPLLQLGLPFLDYVMMRNQGEVGRNLQASYVDRLERFKGELIRRSKSKQGDDIMLVRLRTNNTFRRQIFSIRGDRMEVADG